MPTDTERREVARRLRELRLKPWDDVACEMAQCADIVCCNSECHGSDETPECAMALCARLADLLEPSGPTGRCIAEGPVGGGGIEQLGHDAAVELTGIDRDALRAVAEDVDGAADDSGGLEPLAGVFRDIARCIREALGVCRED